MSQSISEKVLSALTQANELLSRCHEWTEGEAQVMVPVQKLRLDIEAWSRKYSTLTVEKKGMYKCPYCGAIRTIEPETHFDCGYPIKPTPSVYRPGLCYERQTSRLTKLLQDALKVVKPK